MIFTTILDLTSNQDDDSDDGDYDDDDIDSDDGDLSQPA